MPEVAAKTALTGVKIVDGSLMDPLGFLQWSLETGSQVAEYVAQIPLLMLQGLGESDKVQPLLKADKPK